MTEHDWQTAEQFRDELERMRQTLEALEAAERAGVSKEHIETLAYESGVGSYYGRKA